MHDVATVQDQIDNLPELIQSLGVFIASMIPFVEGYGASIIGVLLGIPLWVTVPSAVLGNLAIISVIVFVTSKTRTAIIQRQTADADEPSSPKHKRVQRLFNTYGVPGVTLLGMLLVPTHVTAPLLVSFGATQRSVIIWHAISITLYALVFSLPLMGLLNL